MPKRHDKIIKLSQKSCSDIKITYNQKSTLQKEFT